MTHIDKKGQPFEVRSYRNEENSRLEEMYEHFTPKAKFQGLPPSEKEACRKWILKLIGSGENFLAWREGEVIGHGVLIPDLGARNGEYTIFVNQFNRSLGVGAVLTNRAIEMAKNLSLQAVWLTVDAYNFRAIKLYKRFGFGFLEKEGGTSGRKMILRL